MVKNFFKKYWDIIALELLIVFAFVLFYGSFGDITVDSFREAYIPAQMLDGKVLYRDIFCIYTPLSYIINAFLVLIFGVHLKVFYFAGLFCTMILFFLFSKLSELFLEKSIAFSICLLAFSALVLSPNVFNSFFPYSYGILYGLTFCMASLLCALNKKYSCAYLLAGLAFSCKYEFLLLLPALVYYSEFKNISKNILFYILPPIVIFAGLMMCGLNLASLKITAALIFLMGMTFTLKYFYFSMGLIFSPKIIPIYIINLLKFTLPSVLLILYYKFYSELKFKTPILLSICLFIGIVSFYFNQYQSLFIYAFPLLLTVFILKYRHLTKEIRFIILASLLISLKVFFALTLQSYGVYFIFFAAISFMLVLPDKFKKYLTALLIIFSVVIGIKHCKALKYKSVKISTNFGVVKVNNKYAAYNDLITYVNKLPLNTKVAVYPEGLSVNFLTSKPSDSKFYSLIPLYVETFGEENIIKRLSYFPPEYIVISDYDTSNYFFKEFGKDYALKINSYINGNYSQVAEFNGMTNFRVLKLKRAK